MRVGHSTHPHFFVFSYNSISLICSLFLKKYYLKPMFNNKEMACNCMYNRLIMDNTKK